MVVTDCSIIEAASIYWALLIHQTPYTCHISFNLPSCPERQDCYPMPG